MVVIKSLYRDSSWCAGAVHRSDSGRGRQVAFDVVMKEAMVLVTMMTVVVVTVIIIMVICYRCPPEHVCRLLQLGFR
jgi:hypothetical protein